MTNNDGWGKPTQGWGKPSSWIKKDVVVSNPSKDGWAKNKFVEPSKSWTTQQAVDKAIEKLESRSTEVNLTETVKNIAKSLTSEVVADAANYPIIKADITNPGEGWGKNLWLPDTKDLKIGEVVKIKLPSDFEVVETDPGRVAETLDFGKINQAVEAVQIEIVNDPKELEFLLVREVKLYLESKLFSIDALQVGDLAIWDDGEYFCISHVPTLSEFMKAVPTEDDKEYNNEQLVRWCTKVQQAYKEDWALLRALTHDNYMSKDVNTNLAAMRVRDWCLSVEIE